ncbi:MAG: efflux RND transporter periplasmic adaptor subunit [Magnetococcales bacterium]|nr:efflux RND transporter periplasmic adaptor subunit [Magnetococcales bacterium]MBF0261446.1 efflux RND transporter periplasmic adaptor subunit [Magnetococcales bacterium]
MIRPLLGCLLLLFCLPRSGQADEPLQVTTKPLEAVLIHPREEAPAETRAILDGLITAQVGATVVELPVQVGDTVKSGDLVVRLDPWAYRLAERRAAAELDGLRARLETARKRAERARQLHAQKQASEERVEQSESEVKELSAQARAVELSMEEARTRAEKCLVKAPFDGVIVQRPARVGMDAAPGIPLAQLVDHRQVELSATLATGRIDSLTRAPSLLFSHEGRDFPVTLRVVVPVADPATRAREARLLFTGERPVPGAAGRLVWSDPRPHLPPWLLVRRDATLGFFLAQGDKAVFQPLAQALEGHPALLDPLPEGAVVISGRESLTHGATIQPLPASP